jgi:predicted nucleic acid-binding protein
LTGFVIDASVTAWWFFRDESDVFPDAALERLLTEGATVPYIWWFEIRNALLMAERRGRLPSAELSEALDTVGSFDVTIDTTPQSQTIIDLARRYRLSCYDASYLELALRKRADLATSDKALASAAKAEHIAVLAGDSN